ncbi:alpha/beta fold hydrolase [Teredinibacter purpureus]|uniref:alpha/beta fold hydrolase n=1 Tax=Teredinibacter purpureus TaxID=2731756 RepID=UPI0005F7C834|nr:alpha/beta fold hydrolase [Teredinibacter purpureus]
MDESERRLLRQQLKPLQFVAPFSLEACSAELHNFFCLYGFDSLSKKKGCEHFAGTVRLGGFECVVHCWQQKNSLAPLPQRTVILSHGLFDHSGLYLQLVSRLLESNFTVLMADLPGHGLSEGEPAAINSFVEYANVVSDCVVLVQQHKKRFGCISLIGQSTGAAAILRYLLDQAYACPIEKVVLLAPLIKPRRFGFIKLSFPLVQLLRVPIKRHFSMNSNDEAFCRFLAQKDRLQTRIIRHSWLRAMLEWVEWFGVKRRNILADIDRPLTVPTLIIQGEEDETVDWRFNVPVIQSVFANCKVTSIAGARHHLVNESDVLRTCIYSALLAFLE